MNRDLVNSGLIWAGNIPDDWKILKLKNLFSRRKEVNKDIDPTILSLSREGVKIRDITNNEGQLAQSYDNYHRVYKNDLLLNPMDLISGANCSMSEVDGVISPAYINLVAKAGVNPKFYDYYFKNQYWMNVMFIHGKGVSFDNRWTINDQTIKNYYMVYANLEEQNRRVSFLDKKCEIIKKEIEKNKKSIILLEEYRQSIINSVVRKGIDKKNYKKIDSELVSEIPSDWAYSKLRFLGNFKSGLSNKNPDDFGKGTPFLTYKDVYKNIEFSSCSELVKATEGDLINNDIKRGDVFFTGSSETVEEIGLSSVCTKDIDNGTYNGFCIRFRPYNLKSILPEFAKYYFRSDIVRESLKRNDNSVTRVNLNQSKLKNVIVLLPLVSEQSNIANFLDKKCGKIDDAIFYRKQIIEKLEEYKKSLIYEVVTGKVEV